jgi:hypothetical protein
MSDLAATHDEEMRQLQVATKPCRSASALRRLRHPAWMQAVMQLSLECELSFDPGRQDSRAAHLIAGEIVTRGS